MTLNRDEDTYRCATLQSNSLQGALQPSGQAITVLAPVNDAFTVQAFVVRCCAVVKITVEQPVFSICVLVFQRLAADSGVSMWSQHLLKFDLHRLQTPFYGCTNVTCLLNVHPEVGRSLIAYAELPQAVPSSELTPGATFNTTAAISLTPITISVAQPDSTTGSIVVSVLSAATQMESALCRCRKSFHLR